MALDQRSEQISAVTPDDILDFVSDMVASRRSGYRLVQVSYATAEARKLGLAKRAIETYCAWRPDSGREKHWAPTVAALQRILQNAVVDKDGDRVSFNFEEGEIELIKESISALTEFALVRAADAKRGNKGRRK